MKKITVNINCDGFVIPNPACGYSEFPEFRKESYKELCSINGIADAEKQKGIELWLCNKNSSNINDHGIKAIDSEGNELEIFPGYIPRFFPAGLFEGKVEGDTVDMKVRLEAPEESLLKERCPVLELNFNIKLNQLDYRYRRFGRFETVLKEVM